MTIHTHNLSFSYDGLPLFQNVSLEIAAGECVAIFGPNGGGKTTLLKLLMGFLQPTQGTILLNGMLPQKSRCHIGYVPQISHLDQQFPITTVEVVKMGGLSSSLFSSYSYDCHRQALAMLDKVGLKEAAQTPFGALSGGQSQRALIARALMGNPSYLFLDEPTSSVDPSAEKHFHSIIQELKGSTTLLMVTHDLPTEMSYIDRFYCVYQNITPFSPMQVCDHFAQGLYHPPLRKRGPYA